MQNSTVFECTTVYHITWVTDRANEPLSIPHQTATVLSLVIRRQPRTPLQCGSQSDWRPAYVRSIRWKLLTSCTESGSNFRRAGCETRRMRRRRPEFSNHAIRDSAIIGLRVECGSVARGPESAAAWRRPVDCVWQKLAEAEWGPMELSGTQSKERGLESFDVF